MTTYLARQPILDAGEQLYGYELLFRDGPESAFQADDPDQASSKVISDSLFLMGLEKITEGNWAFVNFTRKLLLGEYAKLFPKDQVGIEILENIEIDRRVTRACRNLDEDGYTLVLDDVEGQTNYERILDSISIAKIDFRQVSDEGKREKLAEEFKAYNIDLVAEKIETREEFQQAKSAGYDYFQGYFFSKPNLVSEKELPASKVQYFRMMREIRKPDLNIDELENIIKQDMSFAYKLLSYINSPYFGLRQEVETIQHALIMLGNREIRRWASLLLMASMGEGSPPKLILDAFVRAKFLEKLASELNMDDQDEELFLMGMFSFIDAFLDRSLEEVLSKVSLQDHVKSALLGKENRFKSILDFAKAVEKGEWDRFKELRAQLALEETNASKLYWEAVDWGQDMYEEITM